MQGSLSEFNISHAAGSFNPLSQKRLVELMDAFNDYQNDPYENPHFMGHNVLKEGLFVRLKKFHGDTLRENG